MAPRLKSSQEDKFGVARMGEVDAPYSPRVWEMRDLVFFDFTQTFVRIPGPLAVHVLSGARSSKPAFQTPI